MDRIITRTPCTCTEYDYECDIGYFRKAGSMTCSKQQSKLSTEAQALVDTERKNNMCLHDGYFTESTGYRLIPGDLCTPAGGAALGPKLHHCSGWENHHIVGYCGLTAILIAGLFFFKDSMPDSINEAL